MLEDKSPPKSSTQGLRQQRRRPISQQRREQNRTAQKKYREKKKCYLQELETIAREVKGPGTYQGRSSNMSPTSQTSEPRSQTDEPASSNTPSRKGDEFGQLSTSDNVSLGVTEDVPSILQDFDGIYSPIDLDTIQEHLIFDSQDSLSFLEGNEKDICFVSSSPALNPDKTPQQLFSTSSEIREATAYSAKSVQQAQGTQPETGNQDLRMPSELSGFLTSQGLVARNHSLQDILIAGLRALSGTGSHSGAGSNETSTRLERDGTQEDSAAAQYVEQHAIPDLHLNTIELTSLSFVAACSANAAMLGVTLAALMDKTTQSPFFQARTDGESSTDRYSHIKPLLRPSAIQLSYPHHVYLDILPFPAFRSRTIQLLQIRPLPFNPEELCHDLCNDGVICWGSSRNRKGASRGTDVPWDIRSWELKSWFLTKWWMLFDGPNDIMRQNSRWWCELRGESFS